MNVALIPVRGGSKSIPLKNIKLIGGKPLVYWTVKAACECKSIDAVYVTTDSKEIRQTVELLKRNSTETCFSKVTVIGRSVESASDTASTEFVMLEFAEKYSFTNIVLIQATSPLLTGRDLEKGFHVFAEEGTDSVLSVVRQRRFHWEKDFAGFAHPTNYDVYQRPRRQEFEGYMVENGAFYITTREALLRSGNRVSGNIKTVEMSEETFLEIDEPADWIVMEALMKNKYMADPPGSIPHIKMLLTDCDGCLTDGGMYYSEKGDELKKFNTRDGMGFALLRNKGIITGIVTGEDVDLNRRRCEKLKLDIYEAGCVDKASAIKRCCEKYGISLDEVCYIGDDMNDLEAIQTAGYGCCPADALPQVKKAAKYVTAAVGGAGVVREIAELICADAGNEL